MELCLGTAQLGMKYGVNNKTGQPNSKDCFEILDYAFNNGINALDTASAYGTSEYIIGEYLKAHDLKHIKIISKLSADSLINVNEQDIISVICKKAEKSLKVLNIDSYDGFLLHHAEHIYNRQVVDGLLYMKANGYTKHIGISIYNMQEGFAAIEQGFDYIQLPVNVFDQRGIHSGLINKAQMYNMKIFSRSVFLQGLFFMELSEMAEIVPQAIPLLIKFNDLLKKYNIVKTDALIGFVKSVDKIDYMIFGAEKKSQIENNIDIFKNADVSDDFINEILEIFNFVEIKIVSPNLWEMPDFRKIALG